MHRPVALLALAFPAALALAACTTADATTADSRAVRADAAAPAPAAGALRLVVAPTGNEARYLVQERLMGRDRDNDAIGATPAITGGIKIPGLT